MDSVYQATLFLSLALLAVVVPVFVFAVTLLGRAKQKAVDERKTIDLKQSEEIEQQVNEAVKELEDAKKTGKFEEAQRRLKDLKKKRKSFIKKAKRLEQRYQLLTLKGSVLFPGGLFLGSIILLVFAKALSSLALSASVQETSFLVKVWNMWMKVGGPVFWLWIASAAGVVAGLVRICRTLGVVQEVSTTSEEASMRREVEALKTAIIEIDEAKKPVLKLSFKEKLPIRLKAGCAQKINFFVELTKGDLAINADVMFFVPEGFSFFGTKLRQPSDDPDFPHFLLTRIKFKEVLKKGLTFIGTLSIMTPAKAREFTLGYSIICEHFAQQNQKFNVLVAEPVQVPVVGS